MCNTFCCGKVKCCATKCCYGWGGMRSCPRGGNVHATFFCTDQICELPPNGIVSCCFLTCCAPYGEGCRWCGCWQAGCPGSPCCNNCCGWPVCCEKLAKLTRDPKTVAVQQVEAD